MEESEVSSSENVKIDEVELRKNFSLYVENIRFELQRYGVQITHSDILGYIMEKLTGNFVTKIQNEKEQNVPINASEDEISRYIIGRKYPYMYRFEEENTELNRFQKFFRSSRLNSLSDQNTLMILRLSRAFNFIFLAIAIFLVHNRFFLFIPYLRVRRSSPLV